MSGNEEVYLKTIYKCDAKRKPLITGPYEDKELLGRWVDRATKENSEFILGWKCVNEKGEVLVV